MTLDAIAWASFSILVLATGVFLWHQTSGTQVWFDEWTWALTRRSGALTSFLAPHNEHLSLIPVAIYKALFATAGIADYGPYRALVIAAHLLCCALIYVYGRRRLGPWLALVPTALIMVIGAGWQNFLWPFQIGWLISLSAGVGALLMLDRRDRRAAIVACILVGVALASSGIGVPIALGVVLDLVASRRVRQLWWIPSLPLAVYGAWWVGYQRSHLTPHNLLRAPSFAVRAASAAMAGVLGLTGDVVPSGRGMLLSWGLPLLLTALGLATWRLARVRRLTPRVCALAAMAVSFWLLVGVQRAGLSTPYESRYVYVGAVLVVLLAFELGAGAEVRPWILALVAMASLPIAASGLGTIRDAGAFLRSEGQITAADLGALDIGRRLLAPSYVAVGIPGFPLLIVRAGQYFALARALGTPAAKAADLPHMAEPARVVADEELARIDQLSMRPDRHAVCPSLTGAWPPTPERIVTLPAAGVRLSAQRATMTVAARRFADTFHVLGGLAAGATVVVTAASDRSRRPWQLRLSGAGSGSACARGSNRP